MIVFLTWFELFYGGISIQAGVQLFHFVPQKEVKEQEKRILFCFFHKD